MGAVTVAYMYVGARIALSVLLLLPMPALGKTFSWGKAGISRHTYDQDSIACSVPVMQRDVARDAESKKYVSGFEILERENNQPPMPTPSGEEFTTWRSERQVLLRRMFKPDKQVDALQSKLNGEVESCLVKMGYTYFQLTKSQEKRLRTLRRGTEIRRQFLFELGMDEQVLRDQQVPHPG